MNWFTKKKVFVLSFFLGVIFTVSYFVHPADFCYWRQNCSLISEIFALYSLPFISVFIFSVITFKLKESTFILWRNFSMWAIPISLLIITMLPMRTHGLDFFPVTKGTVIFPLTILYSVISLLVIISKSLGDIVARLTKVHKTEK